MLFSRMHLMRGRGRFRPYMYSVGSTGLSLQIAASKKKPEDGSLLELPTAMARSRLWWFRGTSKTKDPEAGKGRHVKRPVTDQEQLVRLPVACSRLHHPAVQARAAADERQQDAGPEAARGKEESWRAERQSKTRGLACHLLGDGRSPSVLWFPALLTWRPKKALPWKSSEGSSFAMRASHGAWDRSTCLMAKRVNEIS